MVFMTTSMNNTKPEEAPTGEMRKDAEGKGYWHSYKKDIVAVEEPVVEEPVVVTRRFRGKK